MTATGRWGPARASQDFLFIEAPRTFRIQSSTMAQELVAMASIVETLPACKLNMYASVIILLIIRLEWPLRDKRSVRAPAAIHPKAKDMAQNGHAPCSRTNEMNELTLPVLLDAKKVEV
jgi:hypothetical protein